MHGTQSEQRPLGGTTMSAITNVKEYFDTLDQRFDSEAAKGLTASFQFELLDKLSQSDNVEAVKQALNVRCLFQKITSTVNIVWENEE